jgi:hypothetical protein
MIKNQFYIIKKKKTFIVIDSHSILSLLKNPRNQVYSHDKGQQNEFVKLSESAKSYYDSGGEV